MVDRLRARRRSPLVAALGGLHWYVWRRLVRDTTAGPGLARRVGTVVFVALPLLMVAALVAERAGAPFWLQRTLAWPGFLWLAVLLYLVLALWRARPYGPCCAGSWSARRPGGPGHAGAGRVTAAETDRQTVPARWPSEPPQGQPSTGDRRTAPSTAERTPAAPRPARAASPPPPGGSSSPGSSAAPLPPSAARHRRIRHVRRRCAAPASSGSPCRWPNCRARRPRVPDRRRQRHPPRARPRPGLHAEGRRHDQRHPARPDRGRRRPRRRQRRGPRARPPRPSPSSGRATARSSSPATTSTSPAPSSGSTTYGELGLHPLENARVELARLRPRRGQRPRRARARARAPTSPRRSATGTAHARACCSPTSPCQIHDAVEHGVDLQLSGHTHGGQLWPGNFIADLANPTVAGLERYGDTQFYVSRGAGAWGPPTRVGAPSDITVVELASTA